MNKQYLYFIFPILIIGYTFYLYWGYYSFPRETEIPVTPKDLFVLDGDTIFYQGKSIRLLGYDTPELNIQQRITGDQESLDNRFIGDQEPWASQAKNLLQSLINQSNDLKLLFSKDSDKYGRFLAHLLIDDEPSGALLIRAGLAYQNIERYGHNGFPSLAQKIIDSVDPNITLPFIDPHVWRRTHSSKARNE